MEVKWRWTPNTCVSADEVPESRSVETAEFPNLDFAQTKQAIQLTCLVECMPNLTIEI